MHNKLGKVRPILDAITQKCIHLYNPREVTANEAMINFQGQSSLKQNLPLKPKVWVLADAHNGFYQCIVEKLANMEKKVWLPML